MGQDEKNQMMTTNVWLKQVRAPLWTEAGAGRCFSFPASASRNQSCFPSFLPESPPRLMRFCKRYMTVPRGERHHAWGPFRVPHCTILAQTHKSKSAPGLRAGLDFGRQGFKSQFCQLLAAYPPSRFPHPDLWDCYED